MKIYLIVDNYDDIEERSIIGVASTKQKAMNLIEEARQRMALDCFGFPIKPYLNDFIDAEEYQVDVLSV
ncbi:DUF7336 domain-containing protein [Lentilactobacillus kefiri]|uniref:DUF7336 domain-containing protein n=1 Tax=Lentilactobacillus kefiri TaxID=33962 RepID=UPI000D649DAE|nr:hypothetical protein [Lentilactobacillus kefiri]